MQASLIYFDSCPNWRVARERLRRAINSAEVGAVSVVVRVVITHREAVACGLCGSPTILIDGADPFAGVDLQTGIYCRRFTTEAGPDVAPSVAQLVAALRRAFQDGIPHGDAAGLARSRTRDLPQPQLRPPPHQPHAPSSGNAAQHGSYGRHEPAEDAYRAA